MEGQHVASLPAATAYPFTAQSRRWASQEPPGLHRLLRCWSHLPDPRRSRQSALVLLANHQRSDDARGPRGDLGEGEGAVSEELGRLEGLGEAGRGSLTSLSPLAALPNWRRFFVNLLRGVAPFRRGRYRCWSSICGRRGGLGNYFFAAVLGDALAQSQEAKRCCVLSLKS